MKKHIILMLVFLFAILNCHKNKEKEVNDPEWRKESLEISYAICVKLESCVGDEFSKLKKGLGSYAKSEIKPDKCNEKHKKSRVYLLKGSDPNKTKEVTRECYKEFQKLSCEEIRSGGISKIAPCEMMRQIQQGTSL